MDLFLPLWLRLYLRCPKVPKRSHKMSLTDFKALGRRYHLIKVAAVGFEPTPPERLEPKSSALDRSATLPRCWVLARSSCHLLNARKWLNVTRGNTSLARFCIGRESNPGQLLGRQLCLPLYHQCPQQPPISHSISSQSSPLYTTY